MCVKIGETTPREYGYIINLLLFTALLVIPALGQPGDGHLLRRGATLSTCLFSQSYSLLILMSPGLALSM